jgi:heme exporter protein A
MMATITLRARNIRKDFNRRIIFKEISFDLSNRDSLSITGRNGSGKSTLAKILTGLLTPTAGKVSMEVGGAIMEADKRRHCIGFVAPYLQLYDEFTGYENLHLASRIRGRRGSSEENDDLLKRVGLFHCKNDRVGTYSSGMKQRLKYAFTLLHKPSLLILDEPMSNLDTPGVDLVKEIIDEQKHDGIVVVATNDAEEARMCEHDLDLDSTKAQHADAFP